MTRTATHTAVYVPEKSRYSLAASQREWHVSQMVGVRTEPPITSNPITWNGSGADVRLTGRHRVSFS